MDYFSTRCTVRNFSDKYVSDDLLKSLIDQAAHAPNTGNMQQYSVVITRSPEGKKALAPTHFNQPSVEGCSAVLTFCLDFNRFEHWCRINDAMPGYNNFQAFVWGMIDTSIFAQQFCTVAELNGLGCCYLGTTTYNAPQIAEILQLPSRVVPVTTIVCGYPEGEASLSDRLPVDAIIHNEHYEDYSDERIREIHSYKESLADSKRFIAENGKQTLAQVFTDVRYTKDACEHFSKIYADFIKRQGF
ncbi:MAG: nitroreductase family protein [Bacteroides sp.]|nr:nitroreductase family protein [Bacteroides sp.]MCM1413348.1 nitroreductase family protein [Bacteroides sp.]MCM1471966.1 nitroreductase family protein [Bacteroides sp.]